MKLKLSKKTIIIGVSSLTAIVLCIVLRKQIKSLFVSEKIIDEEINFDKITNTGTNTNNVKFPLKIGAGKGERKDDRPYVKIIQKYINKMAQIKINEDGIWGEDTESGISLLMLPKKISYIKYQELKKLV